MNKYPAIRALSIILKVLAIISSLPFIAIGIIIIYNNYNGVAANSTTIGWLILAAGFIIFIVLYAFSEILTLLIHIEENTSDKRIIFAEDINCPYCGSELELELKEIFSQKFICPDCKKLISFSEYYQNELQK
jgi:hypothetical protein